MSKSLLKEYISEALLTELRKDDRFINTLKGYLKPEESSESSVKSVANDWIKDVELETGKQVPSTERLKAYKFINSRIQGLTKKFHGDQGAIYQTLINLLNAKFNHLE